MKDLFLILKSHYFNEIDIGEKTSEYRLMTDYWLNRLTSKPHTHVTFQLGYAKNAPRLRREIIDIRIKTIMNEFFGSNPVDVFEIRFK